MRHLSPGFRQYFAACIAQNLADLIVDFENAFRGRRDRHTNKPKFEVATEPRFALAQLFFSACAVNPKGKLMGNRQTEIDLVFIEDMRCVVIRHKLANELSIDNKWHKCK